VALPALDRYRAAAPAEPPAKAVDEIAALLNAARRPLLMIGRVSSDPADFARRVALAERVGAVVLTDIKTRASFPTRHPLHPFPPSLYVTGDAAALIRDADVIVTLDWIDPGGTIAQACGGELPRARVVQCSLDQYIHNGWNMDYQALPPTDLAILAAPDALVAALVARLGPDSAPARAPWVMRPADAAENEGANRAHADASGRGYMPLDDLARVATATLAPHRPSYLRLPLGWPGKYCRFEHPLDYIGFDGGGGIGSGPGMAVGAALALRDMKSDHFPVAVLGDGDYLMGITALWTGVHYRVPVLILVANNESFFNDELHQERMARMRHRPVENRWIGLRMSEPAVDLAQLARAQGANGYGPVRSADELAATLERAIADVRGGAVAVVDARVAPEYARAVATAVLRSPTTKH
jgi:thiamine pyrophosphate-dependent acetolactate synthase large subunit-like protein